MRIVLVNVPHPSIGSRIPREQLPPLGLLSVGGPLIDAGHHVELIDGEFGPMSTAALVAACVARAPDAVLFGHSGSSSGHPVIREVSRTIARAASIRPIIGASFCMTNRMSTSSCVAREKRRSNVWWRRSKSRAISAAYQDWRFATAALWLGRRRRP